jgi:PAS domain-containing protein
MDLDGNSLYRTILNAIPSPVFIVDDDVRIADLNGIASTMSGQEKETVLKRRGGEALHCLHSADVEEDAAGDRLARIASSAMRSRPVSTEKWSAAPG